MPTQPPSVVADDNIQQMVDLARSAPPGALAEFGVYQGGTAYRLAEVARERGEPLYLYDTFNGIPVRRDDVDGHRIGDFSDTSLAAVKETIPDAIFSVGTFPGTLITMEPLAFVHVDADQYQSVADAVTHFWPCLVPGGVMLFDDYDCLTGATMAVDERFRKEEILRHAGGKAYVVKA